MTNLIFEQQTKPAYQPIEKNQFDQPSTQRLGLGRLKDAQQAGTCKGKVGSKESKQHHQPDRDGLGHRRRTKKLANQVPNICTIALAHKAIKPPGNKPKPKTSPPLIANTVRTSRGADTVLAVMGSSKYMTFTTRR